MATFLCTVTHRHSAIRLLLALALACSCAPTVTAHALSYSLASSIWNRLSLLQLKGSWQQDPGAGFPTRVMPSRAVGRWRGQLLLPVQLACAVRAPKVGGISCECHTQCQMHRQTWCRCLCINKTLPSFKKRVSGARATSTSNTAAP